MLTMSYLGQVRAKLVFSCAKRTFSEARRAFSCSKACNCPATCNMQTLSCLSISIHGVRHVLYIMQSLLSMVNPCASCLYSQQLETVQYLPPYALLHSLYNLVQ